VIDEERIDNRLDNVENKIESVRKEVIGLTWSHFRWTMGALLSFYITIISILLSVHGG
jgi:tetrahydromethanopterin S-methyltransferase subunit G